MLRQGKQILYEALGLQAVIRLTHIGRAVHTSMIIVGSVSILKPPWNRKAIPGDINNENTWIWSPQLPEE